MTLLFTLILSILCPNPMSSNIIDNQDAKGNNLLMIAIQSHGNPEMVNVFFEYGTDCSIRNNEGFSATDIGLKMDRNEALKLMRVYGCEDPIEEYQSVYFQMMDSVGLSENFNIFEQTKSCNSDRVEELLKISGISPDSTDKNGCTLLFWSIASDCLSVVSVLLNNGADPNKKFPMDCGDIDLFV